MGRFGDALATLDPFLGGNGMKASRWAVHMYVHIHWLTGNLYQVRLYTLQRMLSSVSMHCCNSLGRVGHHGCRSA